MTRIKDHAIEWVENDCIYNIDQRRKYRAIWFLLKDLINASYRAEYLIRDYAHPLHAVMGIASLENCTVQITSRDDYLGWTLAGFIKRIETETEEGKRRAFLKLLDYLQSGIEGIDYSELCTQEVVDHPTQEDIAQLAVIAIDAEEKRKALLRSDDPEETETERSDLGKISKDAEKALYRKKRAEQLAKYLSAKIVIDEFLNLGSIDERSIDFCNSDTGSTAIYTALVSQKSKHIGSSMMELNVCGAVPPYNHILGGKLVALLATSPQVIHDYRERYSNKPSEIASRMKGHSCRSTRRLGVCWDNFSILCRFESV